jgi:hypothetical protein
MCPSEWPKLLPLVQGVLNHSPSRSLAGMSPISLFTGLPARNPFQGIYDKTNKSFRMSRISDNEMLELHADLATALIDMHKKVSTVKSHLRDVRRASRNKRRSVQDINFDVGDFVLVATTHVSDKLEARWKGPFRITRVIHDKVYEVEDLISNNRKEVHVVRLRLFNENHLDVKIKEHIQYHSQSFEVSNILEERLNNNGNKEVLVQWRGFEVEEATWEPLEKILEDVPELYQSFREGRE